MTIKVLQGVRVVDGTAQDGAPIAKKTRRTGRRDQVHDSDKNRPGTQQLEHGRKAYRRPHGASRAARRPLIVA